MERAIKTVGQAGKELATNKEFWVRFAIGFLVSSLIAYIIIRRRSLKNKSDALAYFIETCEAEVSIPDCVQQKTRASNTTSGALGGNNTGIPITSCNKSWIRRAERIKDLLDDIVGNSGIVRWVYTIVRRKFPPDFYILMDELKAISSLQELKCIDTHIFDLTGKTLKEYMQENLLEEEFSKAWSVITEKLIDFEGKQ